MTRQKTIHLRNVYLVRQLLEYYESAINDFIPWSGRTDVTVRFSAEPTGFLSTGVPSSIFGPTALAESIGEAGVYFAEITADALSVALADYVGQTIYQVVEANYGTTYFGLTDVQPLLVIDPRAPTP